MINIQTHPYFLIAFICMTKNMTKRSKKIKNLTALYTGEK
jgi:hypothetical protein